MEIDTTDMPLPMRKMVTLLSDGYAHTREELDTCLTKRNGKIAPAAFRSYIHKLRLHLRKQGHVIETTLREGENGKRHPVYVLKRGHPADARA